MSLELKSIEVGMLRTNCYFLIDKDTNEAAIVDPGAEGDKIIHIIEDKGWKVTYILLTHGHYDHILDVEKVRQAFNAKVVLHEEEEEYLYNSDLSLMNLFIKENKEMRADILLQDGDFIHLGETTFKVLKVPGHTRASVCYYSEKDKILIAGDTLFRDAIGRTDFYDGDSGDLGENIKDKLFSLPDDVTVYPGHGPSTSIGYEKVNNPYI